MGKSIGSIVRFVGGIAGCDEIHPALKNKNTVMRTIDRFMIGDCRSMV